MFPTRLLSRGRLGLSALVLACGSLMVFGDGPPARQKVADPSKRVAEMPARRVVAESAAARSKTPLPPAKPSIEGPTERLVRSQASPAGTGDAANPKVAPGLVRWHADVAAACAAAKKSGKPVLLFFMMGKLDDQFC